MRRVRTGTSPCEQLKKLLRRSAAVKRRVNWGRMTRRVGRAREVGGGSIVD